MLLNAWLVSRAVCTAHSLTAVELAAQRFFVIYAFFFGKRRKKDCVQKWTLRCQLLPKGVRGTGGPPRGARRVKNVNLSFARKGGREIYVFDTLSWKRNTAYQLQASVQGSQSCRGVRGREVPATENVAFKAGHRAVSSTAVRRCAADSRAARGAGVQNPSERASRRRTQIAQKTFMKTKILFR